MLGRTEWIAELRPEQIDDLRRADTDLGDEAVSFGARRRGALPSLVALSEICRSELVHGRGFIVLRGLPVEFMTASEHERALWLIGFYVGIPVRQNPAGDLLVHVRDEGRDYTDPHVRGYQTAAKLDFHVDGCDAVALMCVRAAKQGGTSTIVSAVSIHDEIVRQRPDLATLLYEQFWFDRRSGDGPESFYQLPVFTRATGRLTMYYGRSYLESAQRGPHRQKLTSAQMEAFDLIDELANSAELVLPMDLQPGDVQLLDNRVIMHARTAFEDWPEPERRRDMIRLWLSLDDGQPSPMAP